MTGHALRVGVVLCGLLVGPPAVAQTGSGPLRCPADPAPAVDEAAGWRRDSVGLRRATPYVRGKIPVVFVHGFWANRAAWTRMIAALRADPTLDDRFQFWTFGYATGDPIAYAALLFRRALGEAREQLDPARTDAAWDRMIVVGHSMGGLLAKMMVVETGDRLWRAISPRPVEDLQGDRADVEAITRAMVFAPQPEVRRVVFIATPHGGSRADSGSLQLLGRRLVRAAELPRGVHQRLLARNGPDFFERSFGARVPTSVEELRVDGPILASLNRLPIAPGVRAHSIIAVRPDASPDCPTDGIVTVESARIAGVASEKFVATGHILCLEHAEVYAEVRRILDEHWAAR